jgi:hypothetical protein
MVDLFALALTHGLLALAAWRLMQRDDLDRDPAKNDPAPEEPAQPRRGMRLP